MPYQIRLEETPMHGGAVARAAERWGRPAEGWLDLSTGVSPYAYPIDALPHDVWRRLPDEASLAALIDAARAYYAPSPEAGIVAGAGSQALINLAPLLFTPRSVVVVGVTYSEHAYRWRLAGHDVRFELDLDAGRDADVVIIVNPNNPDGRQIPSETVLDYAEFIGRKQGLLIVDEAFADVAPQVSVTPRAGIKGLLILRSFGKFFGLPGLRLGFALGEKTLIEHLERLLGPWPVSGPALHIGTRALKDRDWVDTTKFHLRHAAEKLEDLLCRTGFEVAGQTDLFKLVSSSNARNIAERLEQQGILVRRFADHPNWLRFGVPDENGYERLAAAMIC